MSYARVHIDNYDKDRNARPIH